MEQTSNPLSSSVFLSRWDSMTARNDAATTSENTVGDDDDETDSGGSGHRPEEEVSLESLNGGDDNLPIVNGSQQSLGVHFQKIAFPTPSPTILEEEEEEEVSSYIYIFKDSK